MYFDPVINKGCKIQYNMLVIGFLYVFELSMKKLKACTV